MPITFFLHIVHLTTLELRSVHFRYEISSSLTSAASKGVAPTASHPVVDRCTWHLTNPSKYDSAPILPFMCRLRFLEIYVDLETMYDFDVLSFLMGSVYINLTSPATLQHMKFYISFYRDDESEDDDDSDRFYKDLRQANIWSQLDSITTHPSGSRLQRVDIKINYSRLGNPPDENKILKTVLDGLPLLRTKDIFFRRSHFAASF